MKRKSTDIMCKKEKEKKDYGLKMDLYKSLKVETFVGIVLCFHCCKKLEEKGSRSGA